MADASNFKFDLVGADMRPFVGYVSAPDRTAVNPAAMVKGSQNIYKKISGTYAVRPGLKRYGEIDSTEAGIKEATVWDTSLATTRVLRACNAKLSVMSTIADGTTQVWYDLLTGLTDAQLAKFTFDTWWNNTLKKDVLLFVYGTDDMNMWHGGIGKISSTTMNTIVLTATVASQGFNTSSGSVLVNGTTYTYTGSSASTLTGVTPDPTGEANGSIALSTVVVTSNSPASDFTNDFIKVIGNRLHVGSYTSRLIYISIQSDYTSFTVPTPRVPGSAELLTLDSLGKGIGVRQGQAHIFGGTSDLYIVSYQAITVGSTLTEATTVDKKALANQEAVLSHKFIDTVGDDLVWLSQDQQVKSYGTFRNLSQPVFPTLSLPVKSDLQAQDFTGGSLNAVGEFIYITAPANGTVWLYQTRTTVSALGNVETERLWHSPFIWNGTRVIVIDGVEYLTSNANPQIYQMWDTDQWHDDSPSDEPLPYNCVLAMAYRNSGRREDLLSFDKTFYEGYMAPGSLVNAAVVLDYQGASGVLNTVINSIESPAIFFEGDIGVSLGDSSLGDNPLGDGLTDDNLGDLPKFRAIPNVALTDCFESQLRVYSNEPDARWEILSLGTNTTKSNNDPTFLQK